MQDFVHQQQGNIGALTIRIGFGGGILYENPKKDLPPQKKKIVQVTIKASILELQV